MEGSFKCIDKAFQANRQAYEKPCGPIVFVLVAGITRSALAADRSCIRPGTAATGTHRFLVSAAHVVLGGTRVIILGIFGECDVG